MDLADIIVADVAAPDWRLLSDDEQHELVQAMNARLRVKVDALSAGADRLLDRLAAMQARFQAWDKEHGFAQTGVGDRRD